MRKALAAALVLLAGCNRAPAVEGPAQTAQPAAFVQVDDAPPPDLRTRRTGEDWPCFLGPSHDGKSREQGLNTDWPAAGPPILWTMELGTGYSAPTVSLGRLFQFHRVKDRAVLACVHAETGARLWEFSYPTDYGDMYGYDNGPRTSPVVDGPRVYVYGPEGMLHCVSAADGKVVWRVDTVADFGVVANFFGVGSTPLVEGDLLIAMVGGSPPGSPPTSSGRVTGNGSGIVAFDKRTGAVRYKSSAELASYASPTVATFDGRRWGFVFARGGLVGFDPATGEVDFEFPWRAKILESVNASNPVVVRDEVFISEAYSGSHGGCLLKVRAGGADVVWSDAEKGRRKSMQTHFNTPVHVGGFLYGSSARHSQDAELRCIEWGTGRIRWSQPGLGWASLTYFDGHFACLTEDGTLRLLRANSEQYEPKAEIMLQGGADQGKLAGQPLLKYPCWAAPILAQGRLYVRGRDRLVCLELAKQP